MIDHSLSAFKLDFAGAFRMKCVGKRSIGHRGNLNFDTLVWSKSIVMIIRI